MSYEDYDLFPLLLALDLASVGARAMTLAELLRRRREIFDDHGYRVTEDGLSPGQAADLVKFGQELAGILATADDDDFIDALGRMLDACDCRPRLTRHDGVPHLHYAQDGDPLPSWTAEQAISGLVLHVCQHGRSRIRRCAAAGCGRWFADRSRNRTGRYCSHACATRTTVAAYRARQRAGDPRNLPAFDH